MAEADFTGYCKRSATGNNEEVELADLLSLPQRVRCFLCLKRDEDFGLRARIRRDTRNFTTANNQPSFKK